MISTLGNETDYKEGIAKGWKRCMICDSAPRAVSAWLNCDGRVLSLQTKLDGRRVATQGGLVLLVHIVVFACLLYSRLPKITQLMKH